MLEEACISVLYFYSLCRVGAPWKGCRILEAVFITLFSEMAFLAEGSRAASVPLAAVSMRAWGGGWTWWLGACGEEARERQAETL